MAAREKKEIRVGGSNEARHSFALRSCPPSTLVWAIFFFKKKAVIRHPYLKVEFFRNTGIRASN